MEQAQGAGGKPTIKLMEIAEAAYVATIAEDGYPDIRAMFNLRRKGQFPDLAAVFALHDEDHIAYFTTNTSSGKVKQIQNDPKAAVYYSVPDDFRGLTLVGNMEVVADRDTRHAVWQEGWEMYYPKGKDDPDHTVLRFVPVRGVYYHRLTWQTLSFGVKP